MAAFEEESSPENPRLQLLIDRLNQNYNAYIAEKETLNKTEIFGLAGEIASTNDTHYYLTEHHIFKDSEIEFLLKFQNPLEIMAYTWHERQEDISDICFSLDKVFDDKETYLDDYPLMPEAEPTADPGTELGNTPADPIQAEAERITDEFLKLSEPNSPNRTHFMIKLSPEFMLNASSKDMERLSSAIPIKLLSFSNLNGEKGIFAFVPKGKSSKVQLKKSAVQPKKSIEDRLRAAQAKVDEQDASDAPGEHIKKRNNPAID